MMGPSLEVPMIRIIVVLGLYGGTQLGNYHFTEQL